MSEQEPDPNVTFRFTVQDTGIGISPEHLEHLFNPFEQFGDSDLQVEGTGLGLAISQRIAKLMGSQIQVQSQLGKGSTFSILLSFSVIQLPHDIASKSETNQSIFGYEGERRRILVLDENWGHRSALLNLLEPLGFDTQVAENEEIGLSMMHQENPDLLIIRLATPDLSNTEFLSRLRCDTKWKDLKVLIFSEANIECDTALQIEADGYLPLPVSPETLYPFLQSHLKLNWIHEQQDQAEVNDTSDESIILPPSPDIIHKLLPLAKAGRIKKLSTMIDTLAEEQSIDHHFHQKIGNLLQQYDCETIEELLQGFLA